uniref:Conotoxin superfamily S n=1 Tax=Conus ermineus TaxID=55423 RepID=A0A346CIT6_CONER|nr:conotoxin precursor superfamily S [Conus ermineus]
MMSKMGAMFVLLLLFTLASSQQEGDVQARKTHLKNVFRRTLPRSGLTCTGGCFESTECDGDCNCQGYDSCSCSAAGPHDNKNPGCSCYCQSS